MPPPPNGGKPKAERFPSWIVSAFRVALEPTVTTVPDPRRVRPFAPMRTGQSRNVIKLVSVSVPVGDGLAGHGLVRGWLPRIGWIRRARLAAGTGWGGRWAHGGGEAAQGPAG